MGGLLIINADDFGGNVLASTRIAECFAMGRITSTSAMVFMNDSRRAQELAEREGIPVGLHLNLTQELDDPATPGAVRERHLEAVRRLAKGRRARMSLSVRSGRLIRDCIADQLECFRDLYGREPSHLDGHNHIHLSPTVLFCLPAGLPIRTAASLDRRHMSLAEPLRVLRRALIARRHPSCERFYPIDPIAEAPSARAIERLIGIAAKHTVELMVHPDREADWRLLTSERWQSALKRCQIGSYADLIALLNAEHSGALPAKR